MFRPVEAPVPPKLVDPLSRRFGEEFQLEPVPGPHSPVRPQPLPCERNSFAPYSPLIVHLQRNAFAFVLFFFFCVDLSLHFRQRRAPPPHACALRFQKLLGAGSAAGSVRECAQRPTGRENAVPTRHG
ncbi:hypothetical protein, unlikely [Trypanosoma brucei gambiense DAL972]|uniref:Uncharacterized protein n=1 Tax=Trypanosoma brucei gambiense (strain MHOM/CI/86/DAL972) TaxID=679716 RepID=C9ZSR2_TRYB9|nr:hypothetical protein, unlikely [Trypanosoma brucei gambiense DAL972]CBH12446.1 hypothetical protein, unlikely [Trypanosoma brucei gambiense DAL972]|eukprot:XP_011774727.1 hypothetical protein, unlikely [Trypanosoma brucei gambiense DAL972]